MNIFVKSFILGIFLSFVIYKSDVFRAIFNKNSDDSVISKYYANNTLTKKNVFQLALINLTEAEESDEKFHKVAKELYKAFHEVGFAYVVDCKGFNPDELLFWTKWFFNLPMENKMKIAKNAFNVETQNVYRGYYPTVPGGHSFKEAFETGLFERYTVSREYPTAEELRNLTTHVNGSKYTRNIIEEKNVWPITNDEESDNKFREVMTNNYNVYLKSCKLLIQLSAVGLGFERTAFDYLFGERALATHRLIHYPTRLHNPITIPKEAWDGDQAVVTGAHADTTFITILATFENPGLQIKPPGFAEWIDVPSVKDRLVINIGTLLSQLTEGKLIATYHRVLDSGIDRYSVPLFYEPCYDGDVSKTFYGNRLNVYYKKYGPYMTNLTSQYAEYATTDFGIDDS